MDAEIDAARESRELNEIQGGEGGQVAGAPYQSGNLEARLDGEPRCFVVSDHELAKKVLGFDAAAALLVSSISSESRAQPYEDCQYGSSQITLFVDRSTQYDETDEDQLMGGLEDTVRSIGTGDQVAIRTISDSPVHSEVLFDACSPACPETGCWATSGPSAVHRGAAAGAGFRSGVPLARCRRWSPTAEVRPLGHRRHAFERAGGEAAAVRAHLLIFSDLSRTHRTCHGRRSRRRFRRR